MKKLIVLLVALLMFSCNDINKKQKGDEGLIDNQEKTAQTTLNGKWCFKNEYVYEDNPSMKDELNLTLIFNGQDVTGNYDWLPQEKDQRKGTLKGKLKDQTITADYVFMQEGEKDTAQIKIVLHKDKAVISGGAPELGLKASLNKTECK